MHKSIIILFKSFSVTFSYWLHPYFILVSQSSFGILLNETALSFLQLKQLFL